MMKFTRDLKCIYYIPGAKPGPGWVSIAAIGKHIMRNPKPRRGKTTIIPIIVDGKLTSKIRVPSKSVNNYIKYAKSMEQL